MIRWIHLAIVTLAVLICATAYLKAEEPNIIILVEGKQVMFDRPVLLREQILVWVRDFERLGWGKVSINKENEIILAGDECSISFLPGRKTATVNDVLVDMPYAPTKIADRVLVPLYFTARALGFSCSTSQALVVDIQPLPPKPPSESIDIEVNQGGIQGRVLYNSLPAAGIKLRLVGDDGKFVPDKSSVSDHSGIYQFIQVPSGKYRVYAYIGDNPDYFNRQTETVILPKNAVVTAGDLTLGMIISPISPGIGGKLVLQGDRASFSWRECPGATIYEISIVDPADDRVLFTHESKTTQATLRLNLRPGRDYQWRVRALDVKGEYLGGSPGKGGEPWTFSLANSP